MCCQQTQSILFNFAKILQTCLWRNMWNDLVRQDKFWGSEGGRNVLSEKKNTRKAFTVFLQNDERVELVAFLVRITLHLGKHNCDISSVYFWEHVKGFWGYTKLEVIHHNPLGFLKNLEISFLWFLESRFLVGNVQGDTWLTLDCNSDSVFPVVFVQFNSYCCGPANWVTANQMKSDTGNTAVKVESYSH